MISTIIPIENQVEVKTWNNWRRSMASTTPVPSAGS